MRAVAAVMRPLNAARVAYRAGQLDLKRGVGGRLLHQADLTAVTGNQTAAHAQPAAGGFIRARRERIRSPLWTAVPDLHQDAACQKAGANGNGLLRGIR